MPWRELTKRRQRETAWRRLTIFPYLLRSTLPGQVVPEGGLMMHLKKATTASQSLSKFWKEKQISKTKVRNGNIWYQIRHSLQQHGRWRLANSSCTQKIDRQFWHVLPEKNYPPHPRPPPHPPGPITRNDRITNKSIRERTEAVETRGLGGNSNMECQGTRYQSILDHGQVSGCPRKERLWALGGASTPGPTICPWCWIPLLGVSWCWEK